MSEKYNLNFSLIFLNSLAHYQHNNWNEESSHKHYFYFTDQILKMILELSKKYDSLIIYNGFSQKKINAQYMIRPKSPKNFLKKIGLKFNSFHSNMTNGAIVTFSNKKNFLNAIDKLKEYNICGYSVFEFKKINKNQLFIRVKIRCKKDLSFERSKLKNIKNYLFYEEKNKILKKNINFKTYDFVQSMVFIKTTSKHTPNGELFFKNIKFKSKRIENIKIFKIIENFFN